MKVLFIGPYRESTGWGEAARRYILEMKQQVDLVTRCVRLGAKKYAISDEIAECENKSLEGVTHVIQNVLPHSLHYIPGVKNIALCYLDTNNLTQPYWISKLQSMDEVWVPCQDNRATLFSVISTPVKVVPIPTIHNSVTKRKVNNGYNFYFIGEFNRRKNIAKLIEAFHCAFYPDENVNLTLKLNSNGLDNGILFKNVSGLCNQIKELLRLRPMSEYQSENIIAGDVSEKELQNIHLSHDCFITASFGESWCIPANDAGSYGNYIIAPNFGGFREYINKSTLVETELEPCTAINDTFDGLMTGHEYFYKPNQAELIAMMRKVAKTKPKSNYICCETPDYKELLCTVQ